MRDLLSSLIDLLLAKISASLQSITLVANIRMPIPKLYSDSMQAQHVCFNSIAINSNGLVTFLTFFSQTIVSGNIQQMNAQ